MHALVKLLQVSEGCLVMFLRVHHTYAYPDIGFPEGSRRDEVVRFLEASTLMKGVKHQYILPVLRVSVEDNYIPLVIYPMVEHGDMHRVIKLASDPEHSILPVSLSYFSV